MGFLRLERDTQRLAGSKQMLLPDHLVEVSRPEQLGERRIRLAIKQTAHRAATATRLVVENIRAGGRHEAKGVGRHTRVADDIGELQLCLLPESV